MELYGQPSPPRYNMSHVTTPVALFHSDYDKLAPVYVRPFIVVSLTNSSLPPPRGDWHVNMDEE
jgi:hypothetical protein